MILRKIAMWVGAIIVIFSLLRTCFSKDHQPARLIKDLYPTYFNGAVESIDDGRGLKIKLKNDSDFFNLSGTCNDTACLAQNVTWGDTLSKGANSDIVTLKSKLNGKVTTWKLPELARKCKAVQKRVLLPR